jgi:serine/threonine protein phosphatase PrpC
VTGWTWIAAAHKGTSHEKSGVRLQDAYSCFSVKGEANNIFFAIVSDGAGSAKYGGEGASIVCRIFTVSARLHISKSGKLPTDDELEAWVDKARDSIYLAAEKRNLTPRDFAATLICLFSYGKETLVAHIGDGCAVLKDKELDDWIAPTWPDHGEYASTTSFITDEN